MILAKTTSFVVAITTAVSVDDSEAAEFLLAVADRRCGTFIASGGGGAQTCHDRVVHVVVTEEALAAECDEIAKAGHVVEHAIEARAIVERVKRISAFETMDKGAGQRAGIEAIFTRFARYMEICFFKDYMGTERIVFAR